MIIHKINKWKEYLRTITGIDTPFFEKPWQQIWKKCSKYRKKIKIEFEKNIKPNQLVFSHTHHTQVTYTKVTQATHIPRTSNTHTTYKQHTQVTHTPQTSNSYKSHTSNTHKQDTHDTTATHYLSTLHRELKNQFHILSKKKQWKLSDIRPSGSHKNRKPMPVLEHNSNYYHSSPMPIIMSITLFAIH